MLLRHFGVTQAATAHSLQGSLLDTVAVDSHVRNDELVEQGSQNGRQFFDVTWPQKFRKNVDAF